MFRFVTAFAQGNQIRQVFPAQPVIAHMMHGEICPTPAVLALTFIMDHALRPHPVAPLLAEDVTAVVSHQTTTLDRHSNMQGCTKVPPADYCQFA